MDKVLMVIFPVVALLVLFALYDWWQDKKHSKKV